MKYQLTILLDMDGVLCDYYSAVCHLFGQRPFPYTGELGKWDFYHSFIPRVEAWQVAPHMNFDFYANLKWTPDGETLISRAESKAGCDNVYLVTSPWHTPGCRDGKFEWVKKNLPFYQDRLMIGTPKHLCSRKGTVLIDDSDKNARAFARVPGGGHAVILPRPWNVRHSESSLADGSVVDMAGLWEGYSDSRSAYVDEFLKQRGLDPCNAVPSPSESQPS